MGSVRYTVVQQDGNNIVNEIHKIIVHRFQLGDVDDPDIYAAGPLFDWERSEAGEFVMKHAVDKPEWHRQQDVYNYGYQYIIVAEMEKKKLSEFYMRFGCKDAVNN